MSKTRKHSAVADAKRFDAYLLDPDQIKTYPEGHALHRERYPDEALIRSIMAIGVKQAVTVAKDGSDLYVVAGQRRVLAAREANKRLRAKGAEPICVKALIERGEEVDLFGVMVTENHVRVGEAAIDTANQIRRFIEMGRTEEQAGVTFGMPMSGIKQHLALFDVTSEVRSAVKKGAVSVSSAAKLAKLDRAKQVAALDQLLKDGGKATVRRASRVAAGKDPDEVYRPPTKHEIGVIVERLREGPAAAMTTAAVDALLWVLDGLPRGPVVDALKVEWPVVKGAVKGVTVVVGGTEDAPATPEAARAILDNAMADEAVKEGWPSREAFLAKVGTGASASASASANEDAERVAERADNPAERP